MRVVDLFSGCGGLSQGFMNADYNIVAAFDAWPEAVETYKKNFSHHVEVCDLSDTQYSVDSVSGWTPDVIIGGPPCQDFSHAGPRREGERANLTLAFAEIVHKVRPAWFVMENVDRAKKSNVYQEARKIFKKCGYGLTEVVLDASFYGVPQKRKRFFLIAGLYERDDILIPFLQELKASKPMTVRDYLGNTLGLDYYYRHPCNYKRRAIFSIDEPAPTVRGVNRPVAPGYPGHKGDAAPVSDKLRPLTTQERALLQTFPNSYIFSGSKTDLEQMIGNAVPVNLAMNVALAIRKYQSTLVIGDAPVFDASFKNWLIENKKLTPRSAKDVLSRLKRVSKYVNVKMEVDDLDLINLLEKNSEFSRLSRYVRPQMRRALVLYREFSRD
ncbi:MAG: DNA (cytosine-5-)-methyltransferase [Deltaproteobacteria bacterium]|nr:MAG: DNA (cytosine-5-)-methyltransferase [Deltaproteobacteria bacterium]